MDTGEVINQSLNNVRIAAMRYFRLTEAQMEMDPSKFVDINNKVLCIDDLERTKFSIVSVLGLLDQLLVENRIKIIILGHEEQIDSDKEKEYSAYKEKVIGKTIQIKQSPEAVISEFIQEYHVLEHEDNLDYHYYQNLLEMKDNIINFMQSTGWDNYRVLRQSLSDAYILFKNIDLANLCKLSFEKRESIIASTVWLSFVQKENDIDLNKIEKGTSYSNIVTEINRQLTGIDVKKKDAHYYLYSNKNTPGFSFSAFYLIAYGELHIEIIEDEVEKWVSEPYQQPDFEKRINYFEEFGDQEISATVEEVKAKLENGNITLSQVRNSFVFLRGLLQINNLSDFDTEDSLLLYFKQSLKNLPPKVFQEYGLSLRKTNDSMLVELNEEINKLKEEKEKEYLEEKRQEWIIKIRESHDNLVEWLNTYNINQEVKLKPSDLASTISDYRNANELAKVQGSVIEKIEDTINTRNSDEKEIEWWESFYTILEDKFSKAQKDSHYAVLLRMNFFIKEMERIFVQYNRLRETQ